MRGPRHLQTSPVTGEGECVAPEGRGQAEAVTELSVTAGLLGRTGVSDGEGPAGHGQH